MKLLFINGVNLNLTGKREKGVYGSQTLDEINAEIVKHFKDDECEFYQKIGRASCRERVSINV